MASLITSFKAALRGAQEAELTECGGPDQPPSTGAVPLFERRKAGGAGVGALSATGPVSPPAGALDSGLNSGLNSGLGSGLDAGLDAGSNSAPNAVGGLADNATNSATNSAARRHPPPSVEELETELLLEAVCLYHGYDFRGYERAVVRRRLGAAMAELETPTISALQARVLHEPQSWTILQRALYGEPALMFDNASDVALLRMTLGVCLHGAALPRVWLADCAGVQQAWTLAILLEQEQLSARTGIYATVASDALLDEVRQASLPMARLTELQGNYLRCGGTGRLLDYFEVSADGNRAVLLPRLADRIVWAQYNLVTDASFNEFQIILGHHALPDFAPALRQRVLKLFDDSLAPFGLLVLDKPLEVGDPLAARYKPLLPDQPWYKRIA